MIAAAMPYSPSHEYVHVAIPKTGTTSLVRALHTLHERVGGTLELVNDPITTEFRREHGLDRIGDPRPGRAKHLSALQLQYILGDAAFARSFRFSVVRNPWARMVSRYNFTHVKSEPAAEDKQRRGTRRSFHDMEFDAWLERIWRRHQRGKGPRSQLSKLTDLDGRVLVEHVGRLDRVQHTIDLLCDHLGVDPVQMSRVNPSKRAKSYADYYDDNTRDIVGEVHQTDIEYFDFTFDEIAS